MRKIEEQVVLISGGGRGLGASIARSFAREGAQVVLNYRRSKEAAEALAEELGPRAFPVCADVRDREQVRTMVARVKETFGAPTTVVHNALAADFLFNGDQRTHLKTMDWSELNLHFTTAVQGALHLIQETSEAMKASKFGRFIHIGTNLFQNPVVPYHDYTASKAALLSLTRTAAVELGPDGITVNMVSGGLLRSTDASAATPDEVFDYIANATPMRAVTTPEEMADAVLFFASPWARAVTGQNLVVDGGLVFT